MSLERLQFNSKTQTPLTSKLNDWLAKLRSPYLFSPSSIRILEKADLNQLGAILSAEKKPLLCDEFGRTPLHLLSTSEYTIEHLELLLNYLVQQCGVDTKAVNREGDTALHVATVNEKLPIMRWLLQHDKTIVDVPNKFGQTALHQAVMVANPYGEVIKLLLYANANYAQADVNGITPLHHINSRISNKGPLEFEDFKTALKKMLGLTTPMPSESPKLAALGLSDPHSVDAEGNTPLHRLSNYYNPVPTQEFETLFQELLNQGADPKKRNRAGKTPLHVAAGRCNRQAVSLLLKFDRTLADICCAHETPLLSAMGASVYQNDIVQLLGLASSFRLNPTTDLKQAHDLHRLESVLYAREILRQKANTNRFFTGEKLAVNTLIKPTPSTRKFSL